MTNGNHTNANSRGWLRNPIPWIITVAVILIGIGVAWGSTISRVSTLENTQKSLTEIVQLIPARLSVLERDINWIRKDMEKQGD